MKFLFLTFILGTISMCEGEKQQCTLESRYSYVKSVSQGHRYIWHQFTWC